MDYSFDHVFDLETLQIMADQLTTIFNVSASLGDLAGKRWVSSNDRRLCRDFHWPHEESRKACLESRTALLEATLESRDTALFQCKNGLTDAVSAIRLNDVHVGNLYVGQFFLSEPDPERFRQQARKFGYDETSYMEALREIPVFDRKTVRSILKLMTMLTRIFGEKGLDMMRQKELTTQYRESTERFELVMNGLDALVYVIDRKDHKILFINDRVRELFGDILGQTCYEAMQKGQEQPCPFCLAGTESPTPPQAARHGEMRNTLNERWYRYRVHPITWKNGRAVDIAIATDITDEREKDAALHRYGEELESLVGKRTEQLNHAMENLAVLSYRDQLTGLYNRRFIQEEMKRLDVPRNLPISLIMTDVDGLKLMNDTFGHQAGDELLQKAGRTVQKTLRADDIVARLGGDEFLLLLPDTDHSSAERVIERIRRAIALESVNGLDISLSFGCKTKELPQQRLQDIYSEAEDLMYANKDMQSRHHKEQMIGSIMNTLGQRHPLEAQHAHRVALYCRRVGQILGLPGGMIRKARRAGSLHDIGKICLDAPLLEKTGPLTDDEKKTLHTHPEIGYRILNAVGHLSSIAEAVLAHHEHWDGSGYPKGLAGEEIPFTARLIAVAEAYEAMTGDTLEGKGRGRNEAIEELKRGSGKRFDPVIVEAFIAMIEELTD